MYVSLTCFLTATVGLCLCLSTRVRPNLPTYEGEMEGGATRRRPSCFFFLSYLILSTRRVVQVRSVTCVIALAIGSGPVGSGLVYAGRD